MANVTINQLNNISAISPTNEIVVSNNNDTNKSNINSLRNFILGIGTNNNFDLLNRLTNLEAPPIVDESSRMHLYNKDNNTWYPDVGQINNELTVTQNADEISIRNTSRTNRYIASIAMITNRQPAAWKNGNQYVFWFHRRLAESYTWNPPVILPAGMGGFNVDQVLTREDTCPIHNLYINTNSTQKFKRQPWRWEQPQYWQLYPTWSARVHEWPTDLNGDSGENDFTNNYLIQAINFK